jgi:hypothetical protein
MEGIIYEIAILRAMWTSFLEMQQHSWNIVISIASLLVLLLHKAGRLWLKRQVLCSSGETLLDFYFDKKLCYCLVAGLIGWLFYVGRCIITGTNSGSPYMHLGRPWAPYARVIFAYTWMDSCIVPAGWNNWGNPENEITACYCEYR